MRMNAQSRLLEEGLLRARVPYLVLGGVGFYERKEVKDVLAYLRLLLNPRDSVALRRVVNVPARGIGQKTVDEIDRAAATRAESAWDALVRLTDEAALPGRALVPLRQFRETIEELRAEAAALGVRRLLERTLERTRLLGGARARGLAGEPGAAGEPGRARRRPPRTTSSARRRRASPASSTARRSSRRRTGSAATCRSC